MQILARSHEHKIRTVTAGKNVFVLSASPDELVTTGRRERKTEGRRKRERAREKEQRRRKRERKLESIRPETDLRNPSQPTDTQNWDSVIVSSVRCTLKRREFAKGTPRINFTLSFTSALDNKLFRQLWPSTQN